jgi:hypothetical protein
MITADDNWNMWYDKVRPIIMRPIGSYEEWLNRLDDIIITRNTTMSNDEGNLREDAALRPRRVRPRTSEIIEPRERPAEMINTSGVHNLTLDDLEYDANRQREQIGGIGVYSPASSNTQWTPEQIQRFSADVGLQVNTEHTGHMGETPRFSERIQKEVIIKKIIAHFALAMVERYADDEEISVLNQYKAKKKDVEQYCNNILGIK